MTEYIVWIDGAMTVYTDKDQAERIAADAEDDGKRVRIEELEA
jgi:hypothetical protein